MKGDASAVIEMVKGLDMIAVYSDENLAEIRQSKGYQGKFLNLLVELNAWYLKPNVNENFQYTGAASITHVSPHETYEWHIENVEELPQYGYGLTGLVEKMYGGHKDKSFREVIDLGFSELSELLNLALKDIDKQDMSNEEKNQLRAMIHEQLQRAETLDGELAEKLEATPDNQVREFEETFGIGPRTLNNVRGQGVLQKIWDVLREQASIEGYTFEKFFGLDQSAWNSNPDRELTTVEKVNAIYNQLNFLGYYRDSKMKTQRGFKRSFRDMTHAGMASFCGFLFSGDKRLVMKASAAYEYLNLRTRIFHFKSA